MNQPMAAPSTTSDAKCCRAANREPTTSEANPYDAIGTISGRGYSWATIEASAQELIAWPEGKLEFHSLPFSDQNPPLLLPSSGRARCVTILATVTTNSVLASASNPRIPV